MCGSQTLCCLALLQLRPPRLDRVPGAVGHPGALGNAEVDVEDTRF